MLGTHFSCNGILSKTDKAFINLDDIEFSYGFGVYENIRLRNDKLYFPDKHAERLIDSAKIIKLKHGFTKKNVEQWIKDLIKKNKIPTANIKILLIGDKDPDKARLYIILLAPSYPDKKIYKQGVAVSSRVYERFLPQAKTLNMLPSYLFFREAREKKAYDMLLADSKGCLLEGTRSNIFLIKDKILYTPPLDKVLNGVTRQTVIDCAKQNGYKIKEQNIKLNKIFDFEGAFLTNTSGKIVPIRTIDQKSFSSITPEIQNLIRLYDQYLRKQFLI
ncbi:MAG: aminotransferase class IV family protein [Candidatus Magasanikbacteria bacterium]|nr:aminotransferase class IV family protein [Candidatus Magasanikbacteria bacterium]